MVIGTKRFVHFKSRAVNCVHGVHTNAPLEAGGSFTAEQTLHFNFFYQVSRALMEVRKTIDPFAGEVRLGRHKILILGILGKLVSHFQGIQRRTNYGMINWVIDTFAQKIYLEIHFTQALFILFTCDHL
ncbi:hypothetical protein SDC9_168513 [bioreactor metagenome]|uniref:Uncharacterized protein n=1 Tax=bioreactor metagenome TaxID=1076179 RepID=A0A645GAN9_9ZZZZ